MIIAIIPEMTRMWEIPVSRKASCTSGEIPESTPCNRSADGAGRISSGTCIYLYREEGKSDLPFRLFYFPTSTHILIPSVAR